MLYLKLAAPDEAKVETFAILDVQTCISFPMTVIYSANNTQNYNRDQRWTGAMIDVI